MANKFNPDWLTGIGTAIIACTGMFALAYAHWQLSEAHEEAQVQHLLMLNHEYEQEPMVTYRRTCAVKRLAGADGFPEEGRILDFFETVGGLVDRGYLKDTDVWENFANQIFPLYADARDTIERDRKTDPAEYSNLLSLVQRLEFIEDQHHGTLAKPSKDDIKEFWKDETTTGVGTPTGRHKHSTAKP
ncbi:MAG TPA: hypothetical protein VF860_07970 [Candidatus Acidoferrales bacterium]